MKKYLPSQFESKWAEKWREHKLFSPDLDKAKNPYYALMMFPYPSAEGLHVGNMYAFTGVDVFARFKRLQGFDVFEPIGLDGFGIHSENYAMKIGEHPATVSKRTEKHFYEQLMMIGNAYDWTRTLETYDPDYYQWTQWLFIQLYKKDLAYRKKAEVNWCPSCKTVLADEQVICGICERCSSGVIKKELEQWFFRTTAYAEKLLENLNWINWSEKVKIAQHNWIGRSEGTLIKFKVPVSLALRSRPKADEARQRRQSSKFKVGEEIMVFTTRPDTVFGATFLVVSPEHLLLNELVTNQQKADVTAYVKQAARKSELERKENKDKTGVFTGSYVKNPLTKGDIPVWVADYVLTGYGTGAIMGVPAHDQRDFEFAKKFALPIRVVIESPAQTSIVIDQAYEGEGILVNSGKFNDLTSEIARKNITDYLIKHRTGSAQVHYHLRDWLISRQRYWGPPIPIIYCDKCKVVPVPEKDLPVKLPFIKNFQPTGTGLSPLASDPEFVNVKCPKCGGMARRETDVSDNFFDSAWYFYRYLSTEFKDWAFDQERVKKWLPVDMYIGGAEHSVLHLLYARFMTMVFKDLGLVDFEEPFKEFRAHGLIIKEGTKMSKSKGNVVNPDQYIKEWGADTLRMYLMFMGPLSGGGDFRDAAIGGVYRFLTRLWDFVQSYKEAEPAKEELKILHQTIKKAITGYQDLHYNTAIAGFMELLNFLSRQKKANRQTVKNLLIMLSPLAPYITEELWQMMGEPYSIHQQSWPKYDEKYLEEDEVKIMVQVNGKIRDQIVIQKDIVNKELDIEKLAKQSGKVKKFLEGKTIDKVIYVPGKILSLVVK